MRKTSGMADVIAEALEPLTGSIDVAFIFGSVARGAKTQGSDVDLMIIGSVDFGVVVDALHFAQQQLSRDINPKVFTPREWRNRLQGRDPFLREVLASQKLFLTGGESELAELGRHQPRADHTRPGNDQAPARRCVAPYR